MSKNRKQSSPSTPNQGSAFQRPARSAIQRPTRIDIDPQKVEPLRGIKKLVNGLDPHSVAATYWLDTTGWVGGSELTVRFRGQRAGVDPGASDVFTRDEVVRDIVPDSGRIAITGRQRVPEGLWRVQASPLRGGKEQLNLVQTSEVRSAYDSVAFGPGVHLLAWPLLVGTGGLLAILLQIFFMVGAGWPWWQPLLITSIGVLVGGVVARLWCLRMHREPLRNFVRAGACIQGFLVGVSVTMLFGALIAGMPLGLFFDVTTPGIFLGMVVGRPGCFLTGCCFGRATSSRWGLWSSDRREGRRRYPVQLFEGVLGLIIAAGTLVAVLVFNAAGTGAVFLIGILLYVIGRQLLFPLRVESRTARGRRLTILASLAGILAVVGYVAFVLP